MNSDITAPQIRAARALVGWSQEELAAAARISARTLVRLETDAAPGRALTLARIRAVLETAGVYFIADDGSGPGVRLRKGQADRA